MPLSPKTIGFRFDMRLETLGPADVLEMVCPQCGHRYMLAPYQLLERFRPMTHLDTISERFQCKRCSWRGRHKHGARWTIYTAHPPLRDVASH